MFSVCVEVTKIGTQFGRGLIVFPGSVTDNSIKIFSSCVLSFRSKTTTNSYDTKPQQSMSRNLKVFISKTEINVRFFYQEKERL